MTRTEAAEILDNRKTSYKTGTVERRSMRAYVNRIAYDKRIFYDVQKEPFYDPEWEEAERADEKPQYYRQNAKCGIICRKYKPAVAELVMRRTGMILTPWKGGET